MPEAQRVLVAGTAKGEVVALAESLSFWGGFCRQTGTIIDNAHPQCGVSLVGKVVTMEAGRGSSSASSALAEAIRAGTAPAALVMLEPDEIIVLGAVVAEELYGQTMPIVMVSVADYAAVAAATSARISANGTIELTP